METFEDFTRAPDDRPLPAESLLAFKGRVEAARALLGKRAGEVGAELARENEALGLVLDRVSPEQRARVEREERAKLRRQVTAKHEADEDFRAQRRFLHRAQAHIDNRREYLSGDSKWVDRSTLESPRRATIATNLKTAGPAALRSAAERAIVEGDAELAGAVLSIESGKSPKDRVVDCAALAERCLPPSVRDQRAALAKLQETLDEAHSSLLAVTGENLTPRQKIVRGLRARGV